MRINNGNENGIFLLTDVSWYKNCKDETFQKAGYKNGMSV